MLNRVNAKKSVSIIQMGAQPSCQCPTTKCPAPAKVERNSLCIPTEEHPVEGGSKQTISGSTFNTTHRTDGDDFIVEVDKMPSKCRFNPGYTAMAKEVTDTRLRLSMDDVCDWASINSSSRCQVETISIADNLGRSGSGMILCKDTHKLGGYATIGEICRNRNDESLF